MAGKAEVRQPKIVLVAAVARNGVIGRDGGLPFRQRADLVHFKAVTMGKPMVMGRKTWTSIMRGRDGPLPGRAHLVLSRDLHFFAAGAWTFASLSAALACARGMAIKAGVSEVCVIGGAAVFAEAMPFADALMLTDVQGDAVGDVSFPPFCTNTFIETSRTLIPAGPQDEFACVVRRLDRKQDGYTQGG